MLCFSVVNSIFVIGVILLIGVVGEGVDWFVELGVVMMKELLEVCFFMVVEVVEMMCVLNMIVYCFVYLGDFLVI